jgi:hypothetical protein
MNCCDVPKATDGFTGVTEIETRPGVAPVPDRGTICGLVIALCVRISCPVLVPATVGVNVTVIVQVAPAASVVPHPLARAKSPLIELLMPVSVVL